MLILSMALTVLIIALCGLLYTRMTGLRGQVKTQREQLDRIEIGIHALAELHEGMQQRVEQLATDVMQREIYHNADDRHENAIKDARAGCDVSLLVQRHGLSSDEAALIFALHGKPKTASPDDAEMEVESSQTWSGDI